VTLCAGIDVGSSAVKAVVVEDHAQGTALPGANGAARILGLGACRVRGRGLVEVVRSAFELALATAGVTRADLDYVATTGEADCVDFRTGHFYSMTTHARGGLFLVPEARAALDIGALHGRVIRMDERGKVLDYRMTSQCASGSGQFLENIGRYLGITLEELGSLSRRSTVPEEVSSICAVLAETDVINMVSRGVTTPDILKGIHLSMAGRLVKLLKASRVSGTVVVTGGLARDEGLLAAMAEVAGERELELDLRAHEDSIQAGAVGAALWGSYRKRKLEQRNDARLEVR
jgi:bcr-type benzoyl-CoA reductase subunit D